MTRLQTALAVTCCLCLAAGCSKEAPKETSDPIRDATDTIQDLIDRAQELAVEHRTDLAVEFDVGADRTAIWIESESNMLERIPDLDALQRQLGDGGAIVWIRQLWHDAGGTEKWPLYEWKCNICGYEWSSHEASDKTPCPSCKSADWPYYPQQQTFYYDFELTSPPDAEGFGDNARQTERVVFPEGVTVDVGASRDFINWDAPESVEKYGGDAHPDIRIGPSGHLVQPRDPVICLKSADGKRRYFKVLRVNGRLVEIPEPAAGAGPDTEQAK